MAASLIARAGRAATRLDACLDRYRVPILALLTIVFVLRVAAAARLKPLLHDEIFTVLLARLPSVATYWAALGDGVDFAPPLNGLATRAVLMMAGSGPIAARVPAMIGFWVMTLAVFAMVRRRGNATLGFAAVMVPFFTAAYRYSYEARPYGLMLGLAALAWLAWSEAAGGRRRPMNLLILTFALSAGLWNHYYAILVYAPVAAGEIVRTIRNARVDGPLWTCVGVSIGAALPLYPLIGLSVAQTQHFRIQPTLGDVTDAYAFLFGGLAEIVPVWALGLIVVLVVMSLFRPSDRVPRIEPLPRHEVVAAAVATLLPLLSVLLPAGTGALGARYAIAAIAAASVSLPLAVAGVARRAPLVDGVLLAALVVPYAAWLLAPAGAARFENPVAARPLLENALRMPGPTVGSGQLWFLQLWYYAPPELKPHFVYLADPDRSLRYTGSDIMDRNYLALARWTPVPVERFDDFSARHTDFRIYACGSGWLLDYLRDAHAAVDLLGTERGGQFYAASLPPVR